MFGNGQQGSGQDQAPQDTGSMWGDMFGIGSLIKVITDPGLQAHTHAMLGAVIEGANANRRIEEKLDRLLKALGHEISDINARWPAGLQFSPTLLTADGADGAGRPPLASGAPDDGASGTADAHGTASEHFREGGAADDAAGAQPR